MNSIRGVTIWRILALVALLLACSPLRANAKDQPVLIQDWQIKWIGSQDSAERIPQLDGTWTPAGAADPPSKLPEGSRGMWVHLRVPPTALWQQPGLLVDRLYGLDLAVFREDRLLIRSERDFTFDLNKLIVQIERSEKTTDYFIRILTTSERAGLVSGVRVDGLEALSKRFVRQDLPDLLLGASVALLSLIMLVCSGYLHSRQRGSWFSLCLVALSIGMLILTYSPLTYIYFEEYGSLLLLLFDVALFLLIPSFNFFIDQVFEEQYKFFTRYRRFQTGYSAFCLIALFAYTITDKHYEVYYVFLNVILSALILLQLVLIIVLSVRKAIGGNRNAVLLSVGVVIFAASATADLIFYYVSRKTYVLFLWKIGVVVLILSLLIILARRISADYGKLLSYSKELELYNHSLQRTEKMKIISDLAASVAHEVRNPLQVTRGFLQLLSARSDDRSRPYFDLATNELDRAADIITDFLTFAKPDLEQIVRLDLSAELKKIEAMMTPLAAMHGAVLTFHSKGELEVQGNSSKLKQALINIIKNSIEALGPEGWIKISAETEDGDAVIRIADNGEGMEEEEVAKLGIPFFSTKTKGTGLGLMVTFRIIEAMRGTIVFHSVKAKGTEVVIRFPLAALSSLPNELHA